MVPLFGRRRFSIERLRYRTRYISTRFAAPVFYWQFVIWFRQLALELIAFLPALINGASSADNVQVQVRRGPAWRVVRRRPGAHPEPLACIYAPPSYPLPPVPQLHWGPGELYKSGIDTWAIYMHAAIFLGVLVLATYWQRFMRVHPYGFQNRIEFWLAISAILVVGVGLLYTGLSTRHAA